MKPVATLERIGLAALAVQDAIAHRSAARKIRRDAYRQHGVEPGEELDEILSKELGEVSDRYKNARRAVKSARSSLRRITLTYRRTEARKNALEAQNSLKQIELFGQGDL